MKAVAKYLWRIMVATALLTGISFLPVAVLPTLQDLPRPQVSPVEFWSWLLASRFLIAAVLTYPTLRSRWSGTQLMCAIFVVFFGVFTFVNISQALLVVPNMIPLATAALLTAYGFLVALLFSFVLVVIMGRMWQPERVAESSRLHLPVKEWLWKSAACVAVGVLLYVLALAITWPWVREFYRKVGIASLGARLIIQAGRALLIVAFVLPVIKMLKGGRWESAITVACLVCVLGGVAPLLIPSSSLPDWIRLIHIGEGGVTHFLYGLTVGYLFSRWPGKL